MSADPFVEHVDVMDAVAQATPGASRMSVMREIITEWYSRKLHEHTLIERVRRGNGNEPEAERNRGGRAPR